MMRASLALAALPLALSACMTAPAPVEGLSAPGAPQASCDATEAQQFVGRTATASLGQEILDMTNSRSLRWGPPDSMFTMDYRADRVNVMYDQKSAITRIYCG